MIVGIAGCHPATVAEMIGNWLKRKIQIASVRGAREDLERFNASLRSATDGQIGMVVAIATVIRLRLTVSGRLPRNAFTGRVPGRGVGVGRPGSPWRVGPLGLMRPRRAA